MSSYSLAEPSLCVLPAANGVLSTPSPLPPLPPSPPPSDYNGESEDDSESDYEALTAGDRGATVPTAKHNKPRTERGEAR